MNLDPQFAPNLYAFNLDALDQMSNTVCAIDDEFRLRYYNDYWRRFAEANQGESVLQNWPLGSNLLLAIQGEQRSFYRDFLQSAMQQGQVLSFEYECCSATLYRRFCLFAYPLAQGAGLLLDHATLEESGILRQSYEFNRRRYVDEEGTIQQCGHCRRIRNLSFRERWDWVPDILANPPKPVRFAIGLCNVCLDYYYPVGHPFDTDRDRTHTS